MHLTAELTADYPKVLVLTYNEIRSGIDSDDSDDYSGDFDSYGDDGDSDF